MFYFSALFFYRDCISRVVLERCRDASPIVVDLLMGSRKRDLTINCRDYSRDQCNGSLHVKASSSSAAVFIGLAIYLIFFKSDF